MVFVPCAAEVGTLLHYQQIYTVYTLQKSLLEEAARFRSKGRLPTLVWMDREQGNFLLRSAQPQPGLSGKVTVTSKGNIYHGNVLLAAFST